jgi:hypothetical protein
VPGRYAALVHLLAWSGARIGELAILPVGSLDLDREAPRVLISQRVYLINGVYDIDTPKSAAGRRRIALPPHLVPILLEHVETYTTEQLDDLVFTSSTGGSVLSTYSQMLSRALARIGWPDARVHDLRHTGMTLAAEAGASLADLKLRMGQSTTRAAELYIHVTTDLSSRRRTTCRRCHVVDAPRLRCRTDPGIHTGRFAHRLRLNPSTVHEVLTRYQALWGPGPTRRPGAGCGPNHKPLRARRTRSERAPRLLLCCHEAQRGATSSIRKTAGLTFGTTYVT